MDSGKWGIQSWCFVEFCSCDINNTALCGLRLHTASVLLFAFPHCLLFAPSVHGTWLLLREANPTCFAISSVLRLGKQREGTTHLVMGPSRCQGWTPGWEVPVGWGGVYFSCVHMGQLGLRWNRSAEHAGWCCWSSCPPSPRLPGSTGLPRYQHETQC